MLGFDPLTLGTLMILSGHGAKTCVMPQATRINVKTSTKEVQIDETRPMAGLQGTHIDTLNPYSFDGISVTQGYMQGGLGLQPSVKLNYDIDQRSGATCIWYEIVNIEIALDPVIFLAKEVAADRCMRKAVLEHEMKHVMADRKIVNKYAQIMGQKVNDALAQRGFLVGPVPHDQAQSVIDRMQATVQQITDFEFKKMDIERQEAQQAIDNLEEYDSVSKLCPRFKMPDEVSGASRSKR